MKQFASIKAMKWAAINVWALGVKKFDTDPTTRMLREYSTIGYLKSIGFNTPDIVASVPHKKLLITRYIEGTKLSEIIELVLLNKSEDTEPIAQWGRLLQLIHTRGYTLMDTKASNILLSHNRFLFYRSRAVWI